MLVRGWQVVVRELLDPFHVLHEDFLRRRRDESIELPFLANRVDEVEPAREDRQETEEGLPDDVLPDRHMDGLEPRRALGRDQILGEGEHGPEDPERED